MENKLPTSPIEIPFWSIKILQILLVKKIIGTLHLTFELPLLVTLNVIELEEILPLQLMKLPLDKSHSILQPGLDHILERIDIAIRGLDGLIEG